MIQSGKKIIEKSSSFHEWIRRLYFSRRRSLKITSRNSKTFSDGIRTLAGYSRVEANQGIQWALKTVPSLKGAQEKLFNPGLLLAFSVGLMIAECRRQPKQKEGNKT